MFLVAAVKKVNFNALVESVRQAGEIVRGERALAREFHIDADSIKRLRASTALLTAIERDPRNVLKALMTLSPQASPPAGH
jgi:hypothetical protein